MKLSNLNSTNFGKVYALYGSKNQMKKVNHVISRHASNESAPIKIYDATDMYQFSSGDGLLARCAREGKQISFVITGEKDCGKIKSQNPDRDEIVSVAQFMAGFLNVDKMNLKDIEEIRLSALM